MNKRQCEKRLSNIGLQYDLRMCNDGFIIVIDPIAEKHWLPDNGTHSLCIDTTGEYDSRPKMSEVWKNIWNAIQPEKMSGSAYCGCAECEE